MEEAKGKSRGLGEPAGGDQSQERGPHGGRGERESYQE